MKIIVSKDIVKLNENHSENHYGEYNVNECVFEFDEYFDSVPIKKAIFTSQSNNKSFEIDIINNKCTVPHEVLTKVYDTVILGVYGYDVNEETLLVRYSPEPTTFVVHEGSYKEGAEQPEIITPTQYDMYSKALQEGLAEVDGRLDVVEKQGDYAKEQGDYAKSVGEQLEKDKENGLFKGDKGDKGEQGIQGEKGEQGEPGKDGENGKDGYAPIKGVDYFDGEDGKDYVLTEADKEEIADNINEENNDRITENEKYISELEATIDILTNTNTASGELVHITDALPLATFENKVDGNVKQETLEGTNYFDAYAIKNTDIVVEDNGKTIKPPLATSGNGFVGTNTKLSELCPNLKVGDVAYLYFDMINISANSLIYINTVNISWQKNTSQTITQEMLDSTVVLYGNRFTSGETEQGILQNFRIVKEENAPWEKFTNNQQTPNPNNLQPIEVIEGDLSYKVTGKNQLENMGKETTINGVTFTINKDKSITVNGTATESFAYYFHRASQGNPLMFKEETEVICSGITTGSNSTYRLNYNYYDINNVQKGGPIVINEERNFKFPTGSTLVSYIYVFSGTTLNNVTFYPMIRLASDSDDTYEPYKEQIVYLDLKGNWAGKVTNSANETFAKDILVTDKKHLWLVKSIGKHTLGNAYSLLTATLFGTTFKYGSFSVPNILIKARNYNFACDRVHKANEQYSPYGGYLSDKYFIVMADEDDTLESFNAKLNGSTLYYPTATTEIIELGELPEPIKTFEGVNNIQLLANLDTEIEVTYALDVKKYFENKLASIQEQIL